MLTDAQQLIEQIPNDIIEILLTTKKIDILVKVDALYDEVCGRIYTFFQEKYSWLHILHCDELHLKYEIRRGQHSIGSLEIDSDKNPSPHCITISYDSAVGQSDMFEEFCQKETFEKFIVTLVDFQQVNNSEISKQSNLSESKSGIKQSELFNNKSSNELIKNDTNHKKDEEISKSSQSENLTIDVIDNYVEGDEYSKPFEMHLLDDFKPMNNDYYVAENRINSKKIDLSMPADNFVVTEEHDPSKQTVTLLIRNLNPSALRLQLKEFLMNYVDKTCLKRVNIDVYGCKAYVDVSGFDNVQRLKIHADGKKFLERKIEISIHKEREEAHIRQLNTQLLRKEAEGKQKMNKSSSVSDNMKRVCTNNKLGPQNRIQENIITSTIPEETLPTQQTYTKSTSFSGGQYTTISSQSSETISESPSKEHINDQTIHCRKLDVDLSSTSLTLDSRKLDSEIKQNLVKDDLTNRHLKNLIGENKKTRSTVIQLDTSEQLRVQSNPNVNLNHDAGLQNGGEHLTVMEPKTQSVMRSSSPDPVARDVKDAAYHIHNTTSSEILIDLQSNNPSNLNKSTYLEDLEGIFSMNNNDASKFPQQPILPTPILDEVARKISEPELNEAAETPEQIRTEVIDSSLLLELNSDERNLQNGTSLTDDNSFKEIVVLTNDTPEPVVHSICNTNIRPEDCRNKVQRREALPDAALQDLADELYRDPTHVRDETPLRDRYLSSEIETPAQLKHVLVSYIEGCDKIWVVEQADLKKINEYARVLKLCRGKTPTDMRAGHVVAVYYEDEYRRAEVLSIEEGFINVRLMDLGDVLTGVCLASDVAEIKQKSIRTSPPLAVCYQLHQCFVNTDPGNFMRTAINLLLNLEVEMLLYEDDTVDFLITNNFLQSSFIRICVMSGALSYTRIDKIQIKYGNVRDYKITHIDKNVLYVHDVHDHVVKYWTDTVHYQLQNEKLQAEDQYVQYCIVVIDGEVFRGEVLETPLPGLEDHSTVRLLDVGKVVKTPQIYHLPLSYYLIPSIVTQCQIKEATEMLSIGDVFRGYFVSPCSLTADPFTSSQLPILSLSQFML